MTREPPVAAGSGPRTLKPLWWALFAAGGMVAALLYPAHVLRTFVLGPGGAARSPTWEEAHAVVTHPLFGAYLVVLVSLPLFHAAHRVLAAFMDFGFRGRRSVLAALLYGGALAGSAFTLWTVFIR